MSLEAGRVELDAGDGLRLHAEVAGAGPALVLLHGFTGAAGSWDDLRDRLNDRFTTIAVDLPGHGRSSAPADPARHALSRTADDLARLLDALDVQHAAVLGYSMGGRAALRFALAHPDRVSALVLESTSAGIADAREREARAAADGALADAILRDGIVDFVDRWERLPLWASQDTLPETRRIALREQRLRNDPHGLANSLRGAGAGAEPPVLDRLGELPMPTLLVAGALDQKYVTINEDLERRIPRARLQVIPDAGHAVHLEQPAAFAAAVAAFLAERVTSARARPPANPAAPR